MAKGLEIVTLGGLRIAHQGYPLRRLASRKGEALLVYLACTQRPHERAVLADLLWDDLPPTRGRANLRILLSSLRQQLGAYLSIGTQTVAFDSQHPYRLDVAELEAQLGPTLRQHAQRELPLAAATELAGVLTSYGGEFLHGFAPRHCTAFEAWVRDEQERLRRMVVESRGVLVQTFLAHQSYTDGLAQASSLLQLDPLHEEVHYHVLLLLAYSGQRPAALAHYERYHRQLDAEIGIAPSDEIVALCQRIRVGELVPPSAVSVGDVRALQPAPAPLTFVPAAQAPLGRIVRLPAPRTPLIGREVELARLQMLLRDGGGRVATVTGPGGVGKTSLALAAAAATLDAYPDGTVFVDLASLHDPELVAAAVAQALGLRETGAEGVAALEAHLRHRRLLLLLDNFEQVVEAASFVAKLTLSCPGLTVLATSRTPLRIGIEQQFPLAPLALPATGQLAAVEELASCPAVRLFVARAQAAMPDFALTAANAETVSQICRQLDGLPLAIELAAARVRLLPPKALLRQLDRRLPILTGGARDAPARQRTLRAALDWSYELLAPPEQRLFAGLAVFVGGWTLDAVAVVCDGGERGSDILECLLVLTDHSLLRQGGADYGTDWGDVGEPRYQMLETIREYAIERLAVSGAMPETQQRHAAYYLALAERAAPELIGPQQAIWMDRLEAEHGNLRVVLEGAIKSGATETALRVSAGLWRFWWARGYLAEGLRWLEAVLGDERLTPSAHAAVLNRAGLLMRRQGNYTRAAALLEDSLARSRSLGEHDTVAQTLNNLGFTMLYASDTGRATLLAQESLEILRGGGDDRGVAFSHTILALVDLYGGDYERAARHAEESLLLFQRIGDTRGIAVALTNLGRVLLGGGEQQQARALLLESAALWQELGDHEGIAECCEQLAALHAANGRTLRATRLCAAAYTLRATLGIPLPPIDRPTHERLLVTLRATLEPQAFAASWEAGCALTLEQTLAELFDASCVS